MTDTTDREPLELPEPVGWEYSFHNRRHLAVHRVAGIRAQGVFTAAQMQEYARLAVKAERERCAKVCEEAETPTYRHGGREYDDTVLLRMQIAAAIRQGIPS